MKKYLYLLLILFSGGMAGAQNLVIMARDGSELTRNLATVQSMKFSAGNLVVKNNDGSTTNRTLSEIRKIYFTPAVTGTGDVALIQKELIRFFPNPVENYIHLENLPEGISDVTIYRTDGAVILRTQVASGNSIIDTGHLNRGIYILMVRGQVMKFVKL